jgi:hypothetical protein
MEINGVKIELNLDTIYLNLADEQGTLAYFDSIKPRRIKRKEKENVNRNSNCTT